MPRLDRLPQINRNNLVMLPVQVDGTWPFTRLARPLSASRLAIVTTAGFPTNAPCNSIVEPDMETSKSPVFWAWSHAADSRVTCLTLSPTWRHWSMSQMPTGS